MASIEEDALAGLTSNVQALLPVVADPELRPTVTLGAARVTPTGLGGFVAPSDDPPGDVDGRRIEASVLVTVKSSSAGALGPSLAGVTRALLGADRPTLLGRGIHRVALSETGTLVAGPGQRVQQDLSFRLLYEHLRIPTAAGGVIETIPLDLEVSRSGARPRGWSLEEFGAGALDLFDVVDDPSATTARPSQWIVNPAERRIEQRSRIRGGTNAATPAKPGTALVVREAPGRPLSRDFSLHACVASDDAGGVGVVFRWVDAANYYFFLMDRSGGYRLLAKKAGGAFLPLEAPAVDGTRAYELGRSYDVKVSAVGPELRVYLDGALALSGRDASHGAGRVGFLSRNDNRAYFYRIAAVEL
ncbi:MAG: hypothetical protein HZB55_07270 [Deltaproteobacteria bacterium]|nr:hypothetical protein [Deltaproteobacteria bacterium]